MEFTLEDHEELMQFFHRTEALLAREHWARVKELMKKLRADLERDNNGDEAV